MRNSILYICIFITAFLSLTLSAFAKDKIPAYVSGEILVKFKDTAGAGAINALHSYAGSVKKKDFGKIKVQHIRLRDDMSVEEAVEYYSSDPDVEYAEPNYIVHAFASIPNDTYFTELWGLHNTGQTGGTDDADIDAPEAWELATGSTDVVIAVVDSGVAYNHPDLSENIWTNTAEFGAACSDGLDNNANGIIDDCAECGDGRDNDGNGYVDDCRGWDFIGADNDPADYDYDVGHGTHVAGTIAAAGNNARGITGVMWKAKIMPLRFLGITGSGTIADAVAAILYATANGAHVINNSWGGTEYSRALKDAIDDSTALVVCAAGNEGSDNDGSRPSYPASYTSFNIIAVAASDNNDNLASYSNFGITSVDLAAPGVSIYSTIPQFTYGAPVTEYSENFNSASGALPLLGWSKGGTNSTWAVTAGTGVGGTNSIEDSPAGSYMNNTASFAGYMTPVTLVKDNIYNLTFKWKGVLENGVDYLNMNFSANGVNWDRFDNRTGSTGGSFVSYSTPDNAFFDIAEIAEMYNAFYFGFGLTTDSSITFDGVYIDDVALTRKPILINGYTYMNYSGTSMAAPHVSGVAGLIKSLFPGLSTAEIKDAILKSIDAKSQLKGTTLTGGRLNAFKALEYALSPYAPTRLNAVAVSSSQIDLSWTDNSSSEEGYYIERKSADSGSFSQIASVGPNITSYSDTDLIPASYFYRVRVFGDGLGDYAYSNEAGAAIQSPGSGGGGGGGCFIATAAYGSMMHPYVQVLREFRDRHLLTNTAGKTFVNFYYKYSPPVADIIRGHEYLRFITRIMLTPAVMFMIYPYYLTVLLLVLILCGAVIKRSKTVRR